MKNTILALLVTLLLVAIVNLLASLGLLGGIGGGGSSAHEYKVLNGLQMDNIGFRAVAKEQGLAISDEAEAAYLADPTYENLAKWLGLEISKEDTITFPQEMNKINMLPRTILEVEKDGGWEFVAVTSDNHYLFKRAK